jgi:hypothetical protein
VVRDGEGFALVISVGLGRVSQEMEIVRQCETIIGVGVTEGGVVSRAISDPHGSDRGAVGVVSPNNHHGVKKQCGDLELVDKVGVLLRRGVTRSPHCG